MCKRKDETYAEYYARYVKGYGNGKKRDHARECREWRERNADIRDIQIYEEERKRKEKMRTNPEYAEHRRASRRESRQKLLRKKGLVKSPYKPRMYMRLPEWSCSGDELLKRCTMLPNCYSNEDLMRHKQYRIENGKRR